MPKKKNLNAQGGDASIASVQIAEEMETTPAVVETKKTRTDEEIITAARNKEQLTPVELERLRTKKGPNGELGHYKRLWTEHELMYGAKVKVFIPLPQGAEANSIDKKTGDVVYPQEIVFINEVKCTVPKNKYVEVPLIVAKVLEPYIQSLHPQRHVVQPI